MSKLISVSDSIYADLMRIKGKRSFSEVIKELMEKNREKQDMWKFFGSMKGIDAEAWKKEIREQRDKNMPRKLKWD